MLLKIILLTSLVISNQNLWSQSKKRTKSSKFKKEKKGIETKEKPKSATQNQEEEAPLLKPKILKKWFKSGFGTPQVSLINVADWYKNDNDEFTHSLELSLINFTDFGWTNELIESKINFAAKIYEQCNVKITYAEIIQVKSPYKNSDLHNDITRPYKEIAKPYKDVDIGGTYHLASITPETKGLKVYFVHSLSGDRYFGSSRPQYIFFDEPQTHTTWISSEEWSLNDDLTTAHELAHVLTNTGHVWYQADYNLLQNIIGKLDVLLNDKQCRMMRESKLTKEIIP